MEQLCLCFNVLYSSLLLLFTVWHDCRLCLCTEKVYRVFSTAIFNHLLKNFKAMVQHGRVELLAHPLSQKYLQMKWNSYGKYFHLANLLFYSIFLFFITIYSSQLMQNGNAAKVFLFLFLLRKQT
jgi:hypothetical protein